MITLKQAKIIAVLFHEGRPEDWWNQETIDLIGKILCYLRIDNSDDLTEKIFKMFIYFGNIDGVIKNIQPTIKRSKVIDTIVFSRSKSNELTILAKVLYEKHGNYYKNLLNKQIQDLIINPDIDIKEWYIQYKNNKEHSE